MALTGSGNTDSATLGPQTPAGPFGPFQIHPVTYCCCFDFEGGESNLRKLGEALGAGAGKEFKKLVGANIFFLFFV